MKGGGASAGAGASLLWLCTHVQPLCFSNPKRPRGTGDESTTDHGLVIRGRFNYGREQQLADDGSSIAARIYYCGIVVVVVLVVWFEFGYPCFVQC